jgi:ankyrin repeat protein
MSRALRLVPILAAALLAACLSPLHHAADAGDVGEIKRLVAAGENPNVINEGLDRWTPMNSAIYRGRAESVQALLEVGADPEFHTAMGTPLEFALSQHQTVIAELIRRALDKKYGRLQPPPPAPAPADEPEPARQNAPAPAQKPWWQ